MTAVSGLHLLVSMTSQVMDARALADARTSTPAEATMSATPGLVPRAGPGWAGHLACRQTKDRPGAQQDGDGRPRRVTHIPMNSATISDPLPPPTFHALVRTPLAQRRPRPWAGVPCDQCTTVVVGDSCSAPMMRAIAGTAFIEPGGINVSNVSRSGLSLVGQLRLDPATSCHSPLTASRRPISPVSRHGSAISRNWQQSHQSHDRGPAESKSLRPQALRRGDAITEPRRAASSGTKRGSSAA